MKDLYPLKFTPIFKDKIWGGQKIRSELGMDFGGLPNCGEVWAISGVDGNPSVVSNGFLEGNELNELVEIYMGDLVGESIYERFGNEFPLLIKFIDSNDWLSIQVHPDDQLAAKRHIGQGKTEMWYILGADEGAQLISGFNRDLDQADYLKHLQQQSLKEILNIETVQKADAIFIPAGRVHALGPGLLLAEIQQTSDTTYRIYDWDRVDDTGQGRALHTEEALEAIHYELVDTVKTNYKEQPNATTEIISCDQFTTNVVLLEKPVLKEYETLDSFVIYIVVEGSCLIKWSEGEMELAVGEAVLVPAIISHLSFQPKLASKLLEVYIK